MAQQKLDLFQFTSTRMTQLGAGSSQVVRRYMVQPDSSAAPAHYVPHHVLREAIPPCGSFLTDGTKDFPFRDSCR